MKDILKFSSGVVLCALAALLVIVSTGFCYISICLEIAANKIIDTSKTLHMKGVNMFDDYYSDSYFAKDDEKE